MVVDPRAKEEHNWELVPLLREKHFLCPGWGKMRGSRIPLGDWGTDTGTNTDSRMVFTEFIVFIFSLAISRLLMVKHDLKSLDKTFLYSKASPKLHGR